MGQPKKLNIVLATGGSGGHLFPAIKTARYLRKLGHEVFFLGSFGVGSEKLLREGFRFRNLPGQGLVSKNPIYLIKTLGLVVRAFWKSLSGLRKFDADVVVGFGGYGSFATILAASFLFKPILLHEQNVVPGKVNRWLSLFAKKIAISFKESLSYFPKQKTVLTGCPTHIDEVVYKQEDVLKELGLEVGRFTIFVFGGSQGSHRINQVFLDVVKKLSSELRIQVIHITGDKDFFSIKAQYQNISMPSSVFNFYNQMGKAYFVSDLVIGRSGASTITEIAMFKKPSILIPYPFAQGHQKENALVLSNRNLAKLLEEQDLSEESLTKMIVAAYKLNNSPKEPTENSFNEIYFVDSHIKMAQEVMSLA